MTDFNTTIKKLIREVLCQDIGIKMNDVEQAVWESINKKINDTINNTVSEALVEKIIQAQVEKETSAWVKHIIKVETKIFRDSVIEKVKKAADSVTIEIKVGDDI